jgi:hypothetical protein
MSVDICFRSETLEPGRYEDGEGREYRYTVNENGTLSIFMKEAGGTLTKDEPPLVVYSPAAWFSVTGDPRTSRDGVKPNIAAFRGAVSS